MKKLNVFISSKTTFNFLCLLIFISQTFAYTSLFEKNACTDGSPAKPLRPLGNIIGNITCNTEKYGRGRIIDCLINHPLPKNSYEAGLKDFLIVVKSQHKSENKTIKQGEFMKYSSSKGLECESNHVVALVNIDDSYKEKISFKWRAPNEDLGPLYFSLSFGYEDLYSKEPYRASLWFSDFPASITECGKNKSCARYNTLKDSDCDITSCKYIVTYYLSDSNTVKFTLDSHLSDNNTFVAIAFTKNISQAENMDIVACIRYPGRTEVKTYIVKKEDDSLQENTVDLQNIETDQDSYYFGCKFERPVKGPGINTLHLNEKLYRVYLWGKLDDNNIPTLPPQPWKTSEKAYIISNIIYDAYSNSSSSNQSLVNILLIVLFFHFVK